MLKVDLQLFATLRKYSSYNDEVKKITENMAKNFATNVVNNNNVAAGSKGGAGRVIPDTDTAGTDNLLEDTNNTDVIGLIKKNNLSGDNAVNMSTAGSLKSNLNNVDNATIDKLTTGFKASNDVAKAQSAVDEALINLKQLESGISPDTWEALNTPFEASSAYQEAMKYTNSLLEQLNSGRTSYTSQIEDLMNQIKNREEFAYDVDSDVFFQQALASAMGSGRTAMQDTIGQASALTGGYGSTYATTAGNQAYNAFIEDAYNNLPEYYQMALEAYELEGQEMYEQLEMLNAADAQEYARMYDAWSANVNSAEQLYSKEYSEWQNSVQNAYNQANLQLSEQNQAYDLAYNNYVAAQNNADALYEKEYAEWVDEVNNAFNYADMLNSDYWNEASFAEEQRRYDQEYAYSLAEAAGDSSSSATRAQMATYKQKALELYNEGGDALVDRYVDSLGLSGDEKNELGLYIYGDKEEEIKGYGELPLAMRTYTIIDDGGGQLGGVDDTAIVEDEYGNRYMLSELKKVDKELAKELSKLKEGQNYTKEQ